MTAPAAPGPEYVTDVAYVRTFEEELGPSRLRLACALNGFPPPPADGFAYCELGSAHGDTLATLAAANPDARFVGVDLNPAHVASAERLARDGGLANLTCLERDFEALVAEDVLEPLDYLTAHGVLSWIGPVKRAAILDLAARRLKPGGLLHVSYNAMPGWAAVEPLRQLIVSGGLGSEGDSAARARQGLELARRMRDAGAAYFERNPAAHEMLAAMEKGGVAYVVHEYLNAHWAPMYFAQVAWEMSTRDLHFVGQLPLHLNYRDLALPPPLAALFSQVADRLTFESLKDYALNEFFRRDVYVKGKAGRSAATTSAYLDGTPFALAGTDVPAGREVRLAHATVRCEGPVFDALLGGLGKEGSATIADLAARGELGSFGIEGLRAALLRAVLAGHVIPLKTAARPRSRDGARLRVPSAYNRMVLARPPGSGAPLVLASPVTGSGVVLSPLEATAVRLLTEVAPADQERWITELVRAGTLRLTAGGRPVEADAGAVRRGVEQLRRTRLAKLVELGIVEG